MTVFRGMALLVMALTLAIVGCTGGGPGGGDATRGRQLFVSKQCVTCHTLPGITEATGTIGPPLVSIANTASSRKPGVTAEAYLRESIKDPDAYTVSPYLKSTAGGMLLPVPVNDQEINDLVAFLLTQK